MQIVIDIPEESYDFIKRTGYHTQSLYEAIKNGTPLPRCKDCKWWKDSDGVYRRGIDAESQCPMNRKKFLRVMDIVICLSHRKVRNKYGRYRIGN